jgi:molecular chaperone HscC
MTPIIGIDLGTTNSAVAHMTADGPRIIPNALGQNLTPSVVGLDADGQLLVGAAARELRVTRPDRTASVFKRHMGTTWTTTIAGREFAPEELSGLVLRSLKADAEAHFKSEVTRAVITVPAYFNDRQRKATMAAGKIAGLSVERILNEPTAAAIAYGFHEAREEKTLLILDLGGGTFDVSVVDLFDGALEVRASSGESVLGGEDFTRTLAARVLERTGVRFERAEMDAPLQVSRLVQLCEAAKVRLSREERVAVRVPDKRGELAEGGPEVAVTRAHFEEWIAHILARIELPVRRVLGDAKLAREDVGEVILVGGATRTPVVVERITRLMGKAPQQRLNPDEVVALGAAVQAGLFAREAGLDDLVVTDVAPFTLGVEVSKRLGLEHRDGYFLPIIQRNTTIPVSRSQRLSTLEPNQTALDLKVYQGESRRVSDNLLLGTLQVAGVPPGPAGQLVDVRFTYDLNGVLEVEATVVATKRKVSTVIARHAKGGMTAAEIREAVAAMQQLKAHPREEAENRFLLRRAERLYQELGPELRDFLGQLLDGFEQALGLQDPVAISANREALRAFLERHDPDAGADPDEDEP